MVMAGGTASRLGEGDPGVGGGCVLLLRNGSRCAARRAGAIGRDEICLEGPDDHGRGRGGAIDDSGRRTVEDCSSSAVNRKFNPAAGRGITIGDCRNLSSKWSHARVTEVVSGDDKQLGSAVELDSVMYDSRPVSGRFPPS